jgi:hypothetical protein
VSDELSPKESARVRSRERKSRKPKVVAVNPGLRNLALHLAEKRKRRTKKTGP